MKYILSVTSFFVLLSSSSIAQQWQIGIFGGASAYNGDLTSKIFPKKVTNGVLGITLNYELTNRIVLRGGINYTVVGGADRYSNDSALRLRNLSFETKIFETSIIAEYYFFDLEEQRFSPYIFAGLAVFHFNPYEYDSSGQRVYLKPLSTEGEGIPGYPDRKPYSLTQPAIPFGAGIKFVINDNFRIGAEVGLRKLFTDYLDDVSKTYVDQTALLNAKGPLAVYMAFRSNEISNLTYPANGVQRGNPNKKDWYYFAGIHLTYRLGNGGGGEFYNGKRKSRNGCPGSPM